LVAVLFVVAAVLTITWKKKMRKARIAESSPETTHYLNVLPSASSMYDDSDSSDEDIPEVDGQEVDAHEGDTVSETGVDSIARKESGLSFGKIETIQEKEDASPKPGQRERLRSSLKHSGPAKQSSITGSTKQPSISGSSKQLYSKQSSVTGGSISRLSGVERMDSRSRRGRVRSTFLKVQERENSNLVFVVLGVAYFIVMCWHYPLVLFLVVPLALWALFKRALRLSSTLSSRIQNTLQQGLSVIKKWAWLIAPPPLPTLMRMFLFADRWILRLAVRLMGSLVSAFIIIGLIVVVATTVVVLLLKVQVELSHYMTVCANVWNMTLKGNPQLEQ
jgi:hypothetical protein